MATQIQVDKLDAATVRRLCGDLPDGAILAIVESGADISDVEAAIAWAAGQDDVMGEERRPLTGLSATVYDLLTVDEDDGEAR